MSFWGAATLRFALASWRIVRPCYEKSIGQHYTHHYACDICAEKHSWSLLRETSGLSSFLFGCHILPYLTMCIETQTDYLYHGCTVAIDEGNADSKLFPFTLQRSKSHNRAKPAQCLLLLAFHYPPVHTSFSPGGLCKD